MLEPLCHPLHGRPLILLLYPSSMRMQHWNLLSNIGSDVRLALQCVNRAAEAQAHAKLSISDCHGDAMMDGSNRIVCYWVTLNPVPE